MFVVEDPTTPLSWVAPLISLGPLAPAYLVVGILWRALTAERKTNVAWQNENFKTMATFSQIPAAIDRLRTEVIQGQKDTVNAVQQAIDRGVRD